MSCRGVLVIKIDRERATLVAHGSCPSRRPSASISIRGDGLTVRIEYVRFAVAAVACMTDWSTVYSVAPARTSPIRYRYRWLLGRHPRGLGWHFARATGRATVLAVMCDAFTYRK